MPAAPQEREAADEAAHPPPGCGCHPQPGAASERSVAWGRGSLGQLRPWSSVGLLKPAQPDARAAESVFAVV